MTNEARAARNAYYREWRKQNPDKFAASQERYWERKAQKMTHEITNKEASSNERSNTVSED